MASPNNFVYKYLTHFSGPQAASGDDFDMNTNSAGTDTVFRLACPAGRMLELSRINFILVDTSIGPSDFGGIAGGLNRWLFVTGSQFRRWTKAAFRYRYCTH